LLPLLLLGVGDRFDMGAAAGEVFPGLDAFAQFVPHFDGPLDGDQFA
jgi:hypothetical protein